MFFIPLSLLMKHLLQRFAPHSVWMVLSGQDGQIFPYTDLQSKIQKKIKPDPMPSLIRQKAYPSSSSRAAKGLPNPLPGGNVAHKDDDPADGVIVRIPYGVGGEFYGA
jgi:hypothetical protein